MDWAEGTREFNNMFQGRSLPGPRIPAAAYRGRRSSLDLEKESREETKSGQKAERELKSSDLKIKSPQKQLATQKTENAQMHSLKFAMSQNGSYSTCTGASSWTSYSSSIDTTKWTIA